MKVKELFARFRAWQIKPFHYTDEGLGEHRCTNCDHTYTGNYCPVCGQAANVGRITWKSVWQNIMKVWGMDSRSLPYTLWQLLWRPGYLIGDYLSGRRQQSYPPTNMLFIVAIFYVLIMQFIKPDYNADLISDSEEFNILFITINWLCNNPGWGMLTITMFVITPTWFLFRFSPRTPRHTFPEGVFIQLFMSTLMMLCLLFSEIIHVLSWLIPIYYYITYRQLFGYRFWGTVWRLFTIFITWFFTIVFIVALGALFEKNTNSSITINDTDHITTNDIIGLILFELISLLIIFGIMFIGYLISKRTAKARNTAVTPIQEKQQ